MDINAESEHIISSDEYSDEVEYDDALMIGAIRGQDRNIKSNNFVSQHQQPNWRIHQKQKQLSSLIRRNKISVIYKNKSIKWLNSKKQRERYKKHVYLNARNFNTAHIECPVLPSVGKTQHLSENIKTDDQYIQDITNVGKKEIDFNLKSNKAEIIDINKPFKNTSSLFIANHTNQIANTNPKMDSDEKIMIHDEEENIRGDIGKLKGADKQTKANPRKRSRSKSPSVLNPSNGISEKGSETTLKSEFSQFYTGINEMFPSFDKIATNHINSITNSCSKNVDEKLKTLSIEIDALNEILQSKEKELNRLSHLKMVKEEIYFRLDRKRHSLLVRESFSDKQHQCTLQELKELETCLSDKKNSSEGSYSSNTIQKLIENRANMNADDLKREKNNTNRLHSLLVSQNMLHSTELAANSCLNRGGKTNDTVLTNPCSESSNFINGERSTATGIAGRLCDTREENPELFARVDKRPRLSDLNAKQPYNYTLYEKNSRSQLFSEDQKAEFFPLPNSTSEISITPIGRAKNFSSSLENVRLSGDRCIKSKIKGNINGKFPRNMKYPLCQECKAKESRFVCAGCGNQWYCSKTCQITAWDTHSEICTD